MSIEGKKSLILNKAIDRINEYDEDRAFFGLGNCNMCEYITDHIGNTHHCMDCPFYDGGKDLSCSHHEPYDFKGQYVRHLYIFQEKEIGEKEIKDHQKTLIERTKKWCERFYPEYTIEEI